MFHRCCCLLLLLQCAHGAAGQDGQQAGCNVCLANGLFGAPRAVLVWRAQEGSAEGVIW
jgi:hypothetical protein